MPVNTTPQVTSLGETGQPIINGAVTLTEGANITITQSGQAITISASSGVGDIVNGGNTGAVIIGTNDANTLSFETNNVIRAVITGGASTGGQMTLTNVTANTATVQDVLIIKTNSTGAAASSFGGGILLQGESSTTDNRDMGRISSYWRTATDASRTSALGFSLSNSAGALTEFFRIDCTGTATGELVMFTGFPLTMNRSSLTATTAFTLGAGANAVTLGGGTGGIYLTTTNGQISISSTGTSSMIIDQTNNTSNGGLIVGNNNAFTFTSGTKSVMTFSDSHASASGTGAMTSIWLVNGYNETGTASGIHRGLHIDAYFISLTAATYRGIDISYSDANAFGVYQSGSLTKNIFVGKTTFGATTTPTSLVLLAAGTATANTAPLKFTSGSLLTVIEPYTKEANGQGFYSTTANSNRYAEGGSIADFYIDVNNGTTVETDLYTYTTKASTLAANGEKLEAVYSGTFNDLTATSQLKVYFAGTAIADTGALTVNAIGGWKVDVFIIRVSATVVRYVVNISTPGASIAIYTSANELTGLTLTNTNILKITGTAAGASGGSNDITAKSGSIWWTGASNN